MSRRVLLVILLQYVFLTINDSVATNTKLDKEENDSEVFEEFVPTHEWQTVKKGQPIPKGLHIRVNLQTGETEAKLLSESETKRTDVLAVSDDESHSSEDDNTPQNHAEAVRDSLVNLESDEVIDEVSEEVRKKFRSYKEIKETFQKLNMTVKTDLEIMNELVAKYKSLQSKTGKNLDEERLKILTDLEYLVHQFDNAREFVRLGGVSDIVLPLLNSTRSDLRSQAAHLLGSAAQSNVRVQIDALENGAIASLLRAIALDSTSKVRTRSLYALSCLVRNFPAAQGIFVKEGGLSVLAKVFEKERQEERALQVKAITLLHDLLLESQDATKMLSEATSALKEELKLKVQQYNAVGLQEKLLEHGWCSRVAHLLLSQDSEWGRTKRRDDTSSAIKDLPIRPEHDVIEKVINAMIVMVDLCHEDFNKNSDLKHMLKSLKHWYEDLAVKESLNKQRDMSESSERHSGDMYYSSLADMLENLTETLDKYRRKDEL